MKVNQSKKNERKKIIRVFIRLSSIQNCYLLKQNEERRNWQLNGLIEAEGETRSERAL